MSAVFDEPTVTLSVRYVTLKAEDTVNTKSNIEWSYYLNRVNSLKGLRRSNEVIVIANSFRSENIFALFSYHHSHRIYCDAFDGKFAIDKWEQIVCYFNNFRILQSFIM